MNDLLFELFEIRSMLLKLRHTVDPMRDLLYRMLNSSRLIGFADRKAYFSDIYDHLLKLSDIVTANREVTADIRDSYLSLNSHLTNNVMKFLTIMTSIFAPLTFIAGVYGMNFEHMPELTWKYGYFLALGIMAIIAFSCTSGSNEKAGSKCSSYKILLKEDMQNWRKSDEEILI